MSFVEYLQISVFLKLCSFRFQNENLGESHHLRQVQEQVLAHLDPSHLQYFIEWSCLIMLEATCNKGRKELREIYTIPPEDRYGKFLNHKNNIKTQTYMYSGILT